MTIKLVQRTQSVRRDGTAAVYVRITANRRSRYKTTGVYVKPKYWNADRHEVRKSHELSAAYNDKLREIRIEAQQAALRSDSAEAVKARLSGKGGSLTQYFEGFIDGLKRRDQYWERKKYTTTLNKLQGVFGRQALDWSELDGEALCRFETYCRDVRGNNPNTTRKELVRLRRIVRQAMKDKVLDPADDPFLVYDLPSKVPVERRRLTREEIAILEAVDLSGERKLELVRDAFLLSFYGGGIRFSDICRLRPEHVRGGRLRYRMMKTDNPVDMPLPPAALAIVERWTERHERPFIFPLLRERDEGDPVRLRRRISRHNAQANRDLKTVAELGGLDDPEEVSMHVARHSFADYARKKSGDLYAVSKALGHSTLQVTENYLSDFDRDATDKLANKLWEES